MNILNIFVIKRIVAIFKNQDCDFYIEKYFFCQSTSIL